MAPRAARELTPADARSLADALTRLEGLLRRQGAPVVEQLRPGLHAHQVAERESELPFRLSPELIAWFGWHDGAEPGYHLPGIELYSLNDAIKVRASRLTMRLPPETAAFYGRFRETWLPIAESATSTIVADCAVTDEQASPVHIVDVWRDHHWEHAFEPSMLSMVEVWIRLLEEGTWRFDAGRGEWNPVAGGWPPEVGRVP